MPIYKVKIKGSSDPARIVRAETAAQARNHIVTVETMTGEQMADELEKGATIERANTPADPTPED